MRFQGFIGPSYTLQSVDVDCQRCINLYPEMDEAGTGKEGEVMSLVSTPGLRLLIALTTGPVRGAFTDSTGQLWVVSGNVLYQISSIWTKTSVGTLQTSSGPVSFCDNGLQMVVVDGAYGYQVTLATSVFAQITDANFLGATHIAFIDGYLIFNKPNSQRFYLSPLLAVTPFDALAIGTAGSNPDNLVGLVAIQQNLYLFGTQSIEVFYDSGDTFPFARIQGAVIEIGCVAAFSIAKIQNMVFWLGQDTTGRGVVYRAQGLQPQRISTFAIEEEITTLGDMSGARAWTYQQAGHSFYCLNLPGADSTWVFDSTTSLWHERTYLVAGVNSRHLADCHAFAYSTNVVGDYTSGNLYALDQTVYLDNGNPILRERTAPHIAKDTDRIFHSRFILDMQRGIGIDGVGQGSDPQAMLQWSNDGGHSWSSERWTSVGALGVRKQRVIWRRLGHSRDRVYRVRISDPVKTTLIGAEIDLEEGSA